VPQYRDDRLARAKFLKELCGTNAFPSPDDLRKGRRFSRNGIWFAENFLEIIRADDIAAKLMNEYDRTCGSAPVMTDNFSQNQRLLRNGYAVILPV
jgi:hypothetical protein